MKGVEFLKIACNYYLETEELVNEQRIDIDYFKFPALGFQMGILEHNRKNEFDQFCSRVTSKKPILLHGLYPAPHDLSSPTLIKDFDFSTANRLIELTKTPGISFHPSLKNIDPSAKTADTVKTIVKNINFLKLQYSHLEFISIENVDSPRFGNLIDPEVITEIILETGCYFLLDISHAFCVSTYKNQSLKEYIYKLPLDKVYEIHINGWIVKDNTVMCHVKINEDGYNILEELLGYCNPKIITIEYGRNYDKIGVDIPLISAEKTNPIVKNEIIEQVKRIRQIINN